jgi:hypothetical protein
MKPELKVVDAVDPARVKRNKEAAEYLRELADRWENNEILEMVVVANDKEGYCFESYGNFEDRWRMLGALEHAKSGVFNN